MEGKVTLKDIVYEITGTWATATNQNMEIYLSLDIDAQTDDEDVEYELSQIRLYHENGFNTHVSSYEELKGKKFVWDSECNDDDEEAGYLYVLEHEDVTKGTMEVLDVKGNVVTIHWSGTANVFWDEKYGEDVPFDTTFTITLPEKMGCTIDAFKYTKVKINQNTELEILNLDEFNKEVTKVSESRQWDDFNTVLKFKVIYNGEDYLGEVIFTNGKNNFVTNMDKSCPISVDFSGVDYNLRAEYEEFRFKIG